MGFEDLNEKIEWEARRVVAAFGVAQWTYTKILHQFVFQGCTEDGVPIAWRGQEEYRYYISLRDLNHKGKCSFIQKTREFIKIIQVGDYQPLARIMARGVYCLGFEDECALAPLPSLTNHEKLELRLSMPREFWPKQWLDE